MRRANPVGLDHLLVSLADTLGMRKDLRLENLKKNWPDVVGALNARNTKPASFRDDVLTVEVTSPVWLTQARFISSTFLSAVNSFDPEDRCTVREIHFVLSRS